MFEFYHGKLIAVTGSTGLNGSYMVKSLADTGARVRAIAHSRRLNEFSPMANEVKEADMTNSKSTAEAVRGAEIVMHAAGVARGAPSRSLTRG